MAKTITNILVTGGAGFIGSNFIQYVLNKYKDVHIVNYDSLTYAASFTNLLTVENNPRYTFVKGDICNYDLLVETIRSHKLTYIVNFAAQTHVTRSVYGNTEDFVHSNVIGVMTLINVLRDKGKEFNIERLVHISTDETYGSLELDEQNRFTEETKFNPSTPYAASKAGGDLLCSSAYNTWKLPIIVSHCSNNYGKYQHHEKLIPLCIKRLLEGKKLLVHGDGLHIRDWIHVLDHCEAVYLLLEKGRLGEIYNVGADCEQYNLDVMQTILKIIGKPQNFLRFVPDRLGNDRRYAIDASKIQKLGWKPKYTKENFYEGLKECVEWYTTK